jgi:hypothetical protein
MRSLFLSLILAIAAPSVSLADEPPAADPVLAEAGGFIGMIMFTESGAPRHGFGYRARRP